MPQASWPECAVDLERWPVDDPQGERGQRLLEDVRAQIARLGACTLDAFLRPDATRRLAAESASLAHRAHHHEGRSTPYLELPGEEWQPPHPRARWDDYSLAALAYDLIPERLRALYRWAPLMEWVRLALSLPDIHPYADPLGACNVAAMRRGDRLNWHFDQTDFVVSIALQNAERGGEFHFVPGIRSDDDECYAEVGRALDGEHASALHLPMSPGTLALFRGRHSLHRVSPVEGGVDRLVALLSYDTKPDTCATPLLKRARYGRVLRPAAE